jgi:multiple sugar transport system permease protein
VASGTTICTLILSSLAAYGFARYQFIGATTISTSLLFGQMMPGVVVLLPLYMLYSHFGMIDSFRVLIISNLAINLPMGVLTLTQFIKNIPSDLDASAMIDGASSMAVLYRIIVPIISPGLVTVGIFSFLNTWEEYLFAFNFTHSSTYKTLPVSISEFKGQFVIDWGGMMSAAVIISVPVLFIFLLCSKYFIRGITEGAVKG